MFRLLESALPPDPVYPADLKELGYLINEHDQIRSIKDPNQGFHYHISRNERHVNVHREAMNECIRQNVLGRLEALGMEHVRLPFNMPAEQPHVPVLLSENFRAAKKIILYCGERTQDLGIFAGRVVSEEKISNGSAIDFIEHVQKTDPSFAVVLANVGQLVWYCQGRRAMTHPNWLATPLPHGVSQLKSLAPRNRIPQNETGSDHIKCVMEQAIGKLARGDAKIYVIGVGDGGVEMIEYLQSDWDRWQMRVAAMCLCAQYVWNAEFFDGRFQEFWSKRAAAYLVSEEEAGEQLSECEEFKCNCYSSGETQHQECVMAKAHPLILRHFLTIDTYPGLTVPPARSADPTKNEPSGSDELNGKEEEEIEGEAGQKATYNSESS